MFSKTRHLQIR